MHPKTARGVMVEDNEIKRLKLAEQWLVSETRALFNSQKDFEAIHKMRKQTVDLN